MTLGAGDFHRWEVTPVHWGGEGRRPGEAGILQLHGLVWLTGVYQMSGVSVPVRHLIASSMYSDGDAQSRSVWLDCSLRFAVPTPLRFILGNLGYREHDEPFSSLSYFSKHMDDTKCGFKNLTVLYRKVF